MDDSKFVVALIQFIRLTIAIYTTKLLLDSIDSLDK